MRRRILGLCLVLEGLAACGPPHIEPFTPRERRYEPGEYAVGHIFMPQDETLVAHFKKVIADVVAEEGQVLLGFRDVPVDNSSLSKAPDIAATEPRHVFVPKKILRDAEPRTRDDDSRPDRLS